MSVARPKPRRKPKPRRRRGVTIRCIRCGGSGRLLEAVTRRRAIYSKCSLCKGSGRVRVTAP